MTRVATKIKLIGAILLSLVIIACAFALQQNKSLIRVGSGYAAKTICSNLYFADRDPAVVMREDVQSQGHPILKLLKVNTDSSERSVSVSLLGLQWAGARAVGIDKGGCSLIHADADLRISPRAERQPSQALAQSDTPWPQGNKVDPIQNDELDALLEQAMSEYGTRAIVVAHNGQLIAERYSGEFTADTPQIGWSLTKTITAILTGMVVNDGHLSLSDNHLFDDWASDERRSITLANLLHMESGLAFNESYGAVSDVTRMLFLENDMAGFTRTMPLDKTPGSEFKYASGTSNLITSLLRERVGDAQQWLGYPSERLFKPLGMSSAFFETDANGNFVGSSYTYATARDWARLGQFLLQDGKWQGKQLLSQQWIEFMTTPSPQSENEYGAHLWLRGEGGDEGFDLPDDAFWLLGHDSQSVAVLPSHSLVVVRLGLTPNGKGFKPQKLVQGLVESGWLKDQADSAKMEFSSSE